MASQPARHVYRAADEELLWREVESVTQQALERAYYGQNRSRTLQETQSAVERALASGAVPPLQFVGMGMTGTVLCDARGHAFKAARTYGVDWRRSDEDRPTVVTNRGVVADEAEWLETAARTPGAQEHVARFIAFHPAAAVIERECVQQVDEPRGGWNVDLQPLHAEIAAAMAREGWSAPEYKTDSYVETPGRGHVLVDAGFALRHGDRLAAYVEDVLAGRRPWYDATPETFAWMLRMDFPEPRSPRIEALLVDLERAAPRR